MNSHAKPASTEGGLRRILLVRNDRIGDLVLTLPAIEAARQTWPEAHLAALVSPEAAPLVARYRAIDEVLVDAPSQGAWQLGRRLRALAFDAGLVFNTNTRNCLAVRSAGIRRRVCWAHKPVGFLTATDRVALRRSHPPVHEAEFALAFVRRLGARAVLAKLPPRLEIDAATRLRVTERIERELGDDGPLFGVHPGNRNSAYNWPPERYAQLVSRLAEFGRVMVTGSPAERPLLDCLRKSVTGCATQRVGWYSDLGLAELTAAIGRQTVLVVSSTGPMHVAGAVGTPTVALFSPHPAHVPAKWAPLGANHTLLVAPLADGEDPRVGPQRGNELMARIGVEPVLRAALRCAGQSPAPAA